MTDFWTEVAWTVGLSHVLIVVILLHDNPSRLRRWARWLAGCIVPGSAILYAIALVAALTIAPYADGKWIIRKVSVAGATYLVDEDFEETGTPTVGTWTIAGASFDSTAHVALNSEAMEVDGSDAPEVALSDGSPLYYKCILEVSGTPTTAKAIIFYRTGAGGALCGVFQNTDNTVAIWANGGAGSYSSTFSLSASTKYYVWLDWVSAGTCYFGISTTDSKPSAPADTATAFATTKTAASGTIGMLRWGGLGAGVSLFIDDLLVDDATL